MKANADLEKMTAAERSKELEAFNRYLVEQLEKIDRSMGSRKLGYKNKIKSSQSKLDN
jgi:hypothetical protein